jgi:hypothetical protein
MNRYESHKTLLQFSLNANSYAPNPLQLERDVTLAIGPKPEELGSQPK